MGDPGGYPVLAFHGTPGSRHQMLVDPGPALAAGVRCVAPDRPGYGRSTFQPGRTLAGWADDVRQLADHLELDRFAVMGMSGGGPHAAACAALLPDRVTAAAILSGIAPVAARGSEAGMMAPNRLFTRLARHAPGLNRVPFRLLTSLSRRAPDRVLAMVRKGAIPPDAAVLGRPEVEAALRRDFAETSVTAGRAAAQDFQLCARDWGFRLEDLTVPVQVWQADGDKNVPAAHAVRQAEAIPGAVLHLLPDEGHFMALVHMEDILRELLAAGRGS
jgi:pimeloyl-ACP methyl ester carboxylesterase